MLGTHVSSVRSVSTWPLIKTQTLLRFCLAPLNPARPNGHPSTHLPVRRDTDLLIKLDLMDFSTVHFLRICLRWVCERVSTRPSTDQKVTCSYFCSNTNSGEKIVARRALRTKRPLRCLELQQEKNPSKVCVVSLAALAVRHGMVLAMGAACPIRPLLEDNLGRYPESFVRESLVVMPSFIPSL